MPKHLARLVGEPKDQQAHQLGYLNGQLGPSYLKAAQPWERGKLHSWAILQERQQLQHWERSYLQVHGTGDSQAQQHGPVLHTSDVPP